MAVFRPRQNKRSVFTHLTTLNIASLLLRTADAARVGLVLEVEHGAHDRELAAAQRRHRRVARVDVHLLGAALGAHQLKERVVRRQLTPRARPAVGREHLVRVRVRAGVRVGVGVRVRVRVRVGVRVSG